MISICHKKVISRYIKNSYKPVQKRQPNLKQVTNMLQKRIFKWPVHTEKYIKRCSVMREMHIKPT